jgi:ABC-type glycerol-3-phosphate transport system substrate-binding protein
MKPIVVTLALALASLGVAACGGGDGGGSQASDADQIRALIDLGNSKNPAICGKLTDKWMQNVVGGDRADCEQQVKQSPSNAVQVENISVNGDAATVGATVEGNSAQLTLVKQDGEWKLDDIQQSR